MKGNFSEGEAVEGLVERLKESLLNSSHVEMIILNRQMEIVWYNGAMAWAGELAQNVGRKCYQALAGDDQPHQACLVRKTLEMGKPQKGFQEWEGTRYLVLTFPLSQAHVGEVHVALG